MPPSISCRASPIASTSRSASSRRRTTRRAERAVLKPVEADELIGQRLQCLPIESLPLAQCAGAVLRENIYAERDQPPFDRDRKSTRLNSSHGYISYAVFCLKKKKKMKL